MPFHPKLAAALVKWSTGHPAEYEAVVWSLVGEAMMQLRQGGGEAAGERQALFRRFDAVLRGAAAYTPQPQPQKA